MKFSIKRKSGTVYNSPHGVKTRRGKKVFMDVPSVGSVCLVDDINKYIVSFCDGPDPYNYKIEAYDGDFWGTG